MVTAILPLADSDQQLSIVTPSDPLTRRVFDDAWTLLQNAHDDPRLNVMRQLGWYAWRWATWSDPLAFLAYLDLYYKVTTTCYDNGMVFAAIIISREEYSELASQAGMVG